MTLLKKIKYFFGTIFRGLIGMWQNFMDKAPGVYGNTKWFSIGDSRKGKDIRCYKVGNGIKKVMIVGGIHGNEVGTVKLAQNIINWFGRNKDLKAGITLFVIPVLNPDGYHLALKNPDYFGRGRVGRFNIKNVDLNRNFPTKNFKQKSVWKMGKNYEDEWEVYCGEQGGSEPEVKVLINLIKQENIKNLIMLHNVGKDMVVNKNDKIAEKWAAIYQKFTKFKPGYSANLSGTALEWARENNINYMSIEGSSRWGSDWSKQRKAMTGVLNYINTA